MAAVYWFICVRAAYPSAVPRVVANQASFNRAAANAIAGVSKSRHGIGDLLARPVSAPITDHLLCDGSAIGRLSYPQLFAAIGTEWGAGDGSTTFNIPNLTAAALPIPPSAPPQDIGGTTVEGENPPTEPTEPGETGGSRGGGATTGGRPPDPGAPPINEL